MVITYVIGCFWYRMVDRIVIDVMGEEDNFITLFGID
jgi:hypothetical protein